MHTQTLGVRNKCSRANSKQDVDRRTLFGSAGATSSSQQLVKREGVWQREQSSRPQIDCVDVTGCAHDECRTQNHTTTIPLHKKLHIRTEPQTLKREHVHKHKVPSATESRHHHIKLVQRSQRSHRFCSLNIKSDPRPPTQSNSSAIFVFCEQEHTVR